MVEVRCRACSGALPTHDPAPLRSHVTHITRAFFVIGSHSKSRAIIDMVIKARLSEMTLAWSKTQRPQSTVDVKKRIQGTVHRRETDGWRHFHH